MAVVHGQQSHSICDPAAVGLEAWDTELSSGILNFTCGSALLAEEDHLKVVAAVAEVAGNG